MSKKQGMYCYYDWIKPLKKVPAEDFKALFLAMLEYHKDGTLPPEFEGITGMAADFIFPQIERSKKYAEIGAKGGAVSQSEAMGDSDASTNGSTDASTNGSTNGSTLKHKLKQKTKTQTQTENENQNQNQNRDGLDPPPTPPKGSEVYGERFERFWCAYPRKAGKQAALKAFLKLKPSEDLLQRMLNAVRLQLRSDQWNRENGQFIPHPATWLSRGQWEDLPTETHSTLCRGVDGVWDDLF